MNLSKDYWSEVFNRVDVGKVLLLTLPTMVPMIAAVWWASSIYFEWKAEDEKQMRRIEEIEINVIRRIDEIEKDMTLILNANADRLNELLHVRPKEVLQEVKEMRVESNDNHKDQRQSFEAALRILNRLEWAANRGIGTKEKAGD